MDAAYARDIEQAVFILRAVTTLMRERVPEGGSSTYIAEVAGVASRLESGLPTPPDPHLAGDAVHQFHVALERALSADRSE